jgi:hypothetical protein
MFIGGLSWQTSPGKTRRAHKDILCAANKKALDLAILNHLSANDRVEIILMIRYSSLRNVTDYRLDDWSWMPIKDRYFSLWHHVHTGSWARPLPPIQWVLQALSLDLKRPDVKFTTNFHPLPRLSNLGTLPLFKHTSSWCGALPLYPCIPYSRREAAKGFCPIADVLLLPFSQKRIKIKE